LTHTVQLSSIGAVMFIGALPTQTSAQFGKGTGGKVIEFELPWSAVKQSGSDQKLFCLDVEHIADVTLESFQKMLQRFEGNVLFSHFHALKR
jgi:hypothetical protein